jgi:hypothetical protein
MPEKPSIPIALPIACSLTAGDLSQRLAEIADLGADALLGVRRADTRAVLSFRGDAATRRRLAVIVAAEAQCCGFLDMTLSVDGDTAVLTIVAAPDAQPVVDDLVVAFAGAGAA